MRRVWVAVGLAALLVGCNDGGPLSCPDPDAVVSGTVMGHGFDPVITVWYSEHSTDADTYVLVIDEVDSTCFATPPAGVGQRVLMQICSPIEPGTYTATSDLPTAPCPGSTVFRSLVEHSDGGDIEASVSGTLVIDSVEGCVSGSFDITYEFGDNITGTFVALICP